MALNMEYFEEMMRMSENDIKHFNVLQKYWKLLTDRLQSDDVEYVIIKGHLYLDYIITRYIMSFPTEEMDLEEYRFTFHQKIGLCKLLGLFTKFPEYERFLKDFNKLRNQIAHRLDFENKFVDQLISSNKFISGNFPVKNNTEKLGNIILAYCFVTFGMISGREKQSKRIEEELKKLVDISKT